MKCLFLDPTRHITYEETNSELAIFYSGKKKDPKSSHYENKISGLVILFSGKNNKNGPKLSHYEGFFF
jgi:hypothetical protein